ncbi:hypothetical protein AYY19_00100 [Photobacterium aquimaris]|uniref:TIR domain-containing protein n=1 Tax=Photobacterium aquimaris TaxID=512643 RepID=UPI0007EFBF77|nr:TIR domain-containing protein [Photobacterium aquimaris]OBU18325.1 hypothetical protein AYY19_00100 [Photobacterium aquimaris]PSV96968.1 TIR domain-containing protein [Photobacterium aquimaris]
MQIFISWSGERSQYIASCLKNWLPKVIQSVNPWMSDEDIEAGARWSAQISETLSKSNIGLICVTNENQHNPWLLFEAGALSKTIDESFVCPLVFEMKPSQLSGPLTQFQSNELNANGLFKVLSSINKLLGEKSIPDTQLKEIIQVWWPVLEKSLQDIPIHNVNNKKPNRTTDEKLDELLSLSREQMRRDNIRLEAFNEKQLNISDKMSDLCNIIKDENKIKRKRESSHDISISTQLSKLLFGQPTIMDSESEAEPLDKMIDFIKILEASSIQTRNKILDVPITKEE